MKYILIVFIIEGTSGIYTQLLIILIQGGLLLCYGCLFICMLFLIIKIAKSFRLSFGVYFYTLCSALILTLMKSHRLFYSTFFPSTVFTVCRTSIFLLATRLLFNLIVLSSNDDEQV